MTPDDPRHGTHAGRRAHQRAGQDTCEACSAANALYQRRYRKTRALYGNRMLPAQGTTRRIHALMRLGWSIPNIGQTAGVAPKQLWMTTTQQTVTRDVANRVAHAYDLLHMTLPATETTSQRISVSKVRTHAERMGYAPPLAWDDIDNDPEPATGEASDDVDPVVVTRILNGHVVPTTRAERLEVVRRWVLDGRPTNELGRLTGWRIERYYKASEAA